MTRIWLRHTYTKKPHQNPSIKTHTTAGDRDRYTLILWSWVDISITESKHYNTFRFCLQLIFEGVGVRKDQFDKITPRSLYFQLQVKVLMFRHLD